MAGLDRQRGGVPQGDDSPKGLAFIPWDWHFSVTELAYHSALESSPHQLDVVLSGVIRRVLAAPAASVQQREQQLTPGVYAQEFCRLIDVDLKRGVIPVEGTAQNTLTLHIHLQTPPKTQNPAFKNYPRTYIKNITIYLLLFYQ
ncbi:hypothetical protein GZ982_29950 (plasmid) [Pseudomonas fluorescens]|nr:hypothetical protein GZ982_29950 [Pseudomonas fluorescens]